MLITDILVMIIQAIRQLILILVVLKVILSYFMDPFHPFRKAVDSWIGPMLKPIQQVVPNFGGFDFSPMILIIVVEVLASILLSVL